MTRGELIRWSRLHDRRARAGWWSSPWAIALGMGGLVAALVAWRAAAAGYGAASTAWLACAIAVFAFAFLRVPSLIYWRSDAALLAQLPIEGGALLDAALLRCARAAAATTLAAIAGALPLCGASARLYAHHVAYAGVLGLCAAALLPAAATWAALLVASGPAGGARAVRVAVAVASGSPRRAVAAAATRAPASPGAVLGALPGVIASGAIVVALIASPYLTFGATAREVAPWLGGLALASVLALAAVHSPGARVMPVILRDVSALDRQRLAPLEIRPLTAIERAIAAALGGAALAYRKDARLMRRRYPMAFALGALAFLVLAIVALARPADPAPWLVAVLGAAAAYGVALAGRLHRPPIELPRLAATLPIAAAARARARIAWVLGWWCVFVIVPSAFALARLPERAVGAALLGGGTLVVIAASARREHV
ncbi:MAG TPA: hypothetical protein VLX92_05925 [Kofleriaceae bacterium]|nr:hypothetical protein [Kofleriaceae bacterium]